MSWKNLDSSHKVFFYSANMASTSMPKFETEISPDGETPQFTLKESDQYCKGHYALQMTYFRGKVYLHLQGN